jgi:hypothetical protein
MARLNFTVRGLRQCGLTGAAAVDEILRALNDNNFGEARFDRGLEVFSVEIDPAVHSFSDVRRLIDALGRRRGLVYFAVVMSP